MKNRALIVTVIISLIVSNITAQFSLEWTGPQIIQEPVNSDIEFDFNLINETSSTLELRWRLIDNDFPTDKWDDYVCDVVCYDSSMRARNLDINGDTIFPIILHIAMDNDEGFGTSQLCFWERADSAGTIRCITARATTCWNFVDTMEISHNSMIYYVIEGSVYERSGTTYTMVSASGTISSMNCDLLTIGEDILEFEYSEFAEFTDYEQYEYNGEDIYIIDGRYYVYNGSKYVLQGDAEEDKVDGVDVIILDGDTFELFNNELVPLGFETIFESTLQVYPIPSTDIIYISGLQHGTAHVDLLDATGRLIMSEKSSGELNVSLLPVGVYSLIIKEQTHTSTVQISIVR